MKFVNMYPSIIYRTHILNNDLMRLFLVLKCCNEKNAPYLTSLKVTRIIFKLVNVCVLLKSCIVGYSFFVSVFYWNT